MCGKEGGRDRDVELGEEECEGRRVCGDESKGGDSGRVVKSKTIRLVDELSLECKPRGKGHRSIRAYWECLSLYRRLRDEGVAAHQWWG